MLNLVKGHRVSLVENLFESFTKLTEHHLTANVHAEKILEIFQHFIVIHDEPLFFIFSKNIIKCNKLISFLIGTINFRR